MIFKDCYPSAPVEQLVQVYRLRHFIIPPNLPVVPKSYPARPEQCIVFYIRGAEYTDRPLHNIRMHKPRLVITGQNTELLHRYSATNEFLMVQAVFYPGVLHRLIGIPFHELHNNFIDLEEVMPAEGREVMERLYNAEPYEEIIRIIDEFVVSMAARPKLEAKPIDDVIRQILYAPTQQTVEWYAKEACFSHKQFERKCYEYMGISPKQYARISRFAMSYDMRQNNPGMDWLTIAINCGYYDYQHLVRDYIAFSNNKPNGIIEAESQALERRLGLLRKKL